MKIQKIIILLLVFSMVLINATSVWAVDAEESLVELIDVTKEKYNTNDEVSNSLASSDEILAQSKPATTLFDQGKGISQKDNFASYYFYNLIAKFGNNTIGSCGYVATAMMLSYYDTYLNDNIIDNIFDAPTSLLSLNLKSSHSSPGILRENDSLLGGSLTSDSMIKALDSNGYWNLIENNYLSSFHLYLIKLAECEFNMYHDTIAVLEECGITMEIDSNYPCASTLLHQKSLIEHYLYEIKGLEGRASLEYANTDVRNFAINKIKNGQPVMLLLGSTGGFHLVVAYDLDTNGTEDISDDIIYAHYGWEEKRYSDGSNKYYTHVNIDTDNYPWLVSALAMNFDMEHSCSDNYSYGTTNYCSCYFSCHPEHVHQYELSSDNSQHKYTCNCSFYDSNYYDHDYEYISKDSDCHNIVCADCSHTITEEHSMYTRSVGNGQHAEKCLDCGYIDESTRESHTYEYWVYVNTTTHVSECGCGARGTTMANHVFGFPDPLTGEMICRGCGYTKIYGSDSGNIILGITKVSVNGSYILPDGNIVLADEDVEAYLNGTLVFYDKDDLPVTQ